VEALAAVGLGDGRAVTHLLAEVDGVAVGCAAAVVAGDAVAVEHIVTAASHRRQGIGTRLTVAALETGRRLGAATAVLTASPDGAAIYRRLGFVERDTVRRFT
ncbi:GNAT family N-acetyltransferase, partial [Brevibacillus sp. SIMBA_076]